jgi:hypothetical protein
VRGEAIILYESGTTNNVFNNNQPYWGHGSIGSYYNGADTINSNLPYFTGTYIQSIGFSGSTLYWWANYTSETTESTSVPSSSLFLYQLVTYPSSSCIADISWVDARAFPPGAVMPSVSFGSVE